MLQIRSILDVADNSGAKRAAAIGVLGRNQRYARVGDIIKAHIKEAAPDGTVKKGEVVDAVVVRVERRYQHLKFKKVVTGHRKYYAHDEKQEAKVGDRVRIEETRPLSKTKRWRLVAVVERGEEAAPGVA